MFVALIGLTLVVAATDWWAVATDRRSVEYVLKPLTMVVLIGAAVSLSDPASEAARWWMVAGLVCSLAGDVFLMLSDRWFIAGLAAFLLAHVAYIVGFNLPLPVVSPLWSVGLAIVLALSAARVLRRIVAGLREKGLQRLAGPVMLYGTVITVMLLSAMLTLFRPDWPSTAAAGLVALGAFLFFFSDIILAWNKFVAPIKNGRVMNMVAYHLGQIALIAGVYIQFVK